MFRLVGCWRRVRVGLPALRASALAATCRRIRAVQTAGRGVCAGCGGLCAALWGDAERGGAAVAGVAGERGGHRRASAQTLSRAAGRGVDRPCAGVADRRVADRDGAGGRHQHHRRRAVAADRVSHRRAARPGTMSSARCSSAGPSSTRCCRQPRDGARRAHRRIGDADRARSTRRGPTLPRSAREAEALTGVKVRFDLADRPVADLALAGGARIDRACIRPTGKRYACTTGFAVTDGTRTGIATAAHCPDDGDLSGPRRRERSRSTSSGNGARGRRTCKSMSGRSGSSPLFYADRRQGRCGRWRGRGRG